MTRRLLAAFSVLVFLAQALWPLIAQARPATLVSVCSAGGVIHQIELPEGGTPTAKHCPLCVVGTPPAVLASAPAFAPRVPPAAAAPRDRASSVLPEVRETPGRPRAPPLPL